MSDTLAAARALLRDLVLSDPCRVERIDASYLDDLPDILREMHGITAFAGPASAAREKLATLAGLAGVAPDAPLADLAPALRRLGVADEEFRPPRLADKERLDRFKHTQQKSFAEVTEAGNRDGRPNIPLILKYQEEFSRKGERSLLRLRYLWKNPIYLYKWAMMRYGYTEKALARPLIGDTWTPIFKDMLARGLLKADDPVLTIGPRNAAEVVYFRKIVGLRKTIGLDVFTQRPSLVTVGDMHAMPFPDNRFALVYQRNTFDKAYDIRQVMRECVRVLRDGGYLVSDLSLDCYHGVDEAGRTNVTRNEWFLRFLGDRVAEVVYDKDDWPHTNKDEYPRVGQLMVRIRKTPAAAMAQAG